MMCLLNGGERTLNEFKDLGWVSYYKYFTFEDSLIHVVSVSAKAGLKFVKLWDFAENAMVEYEAA